MGLQIIALVVLAGTHHSATMDWSQISEKLRGVGETYKKWGITFEVKSKEQFLAEGPLPGALEVGGQYNSDNSLSFELQTNVGEKHALAFNFGAKFNIGPDGTTKTGSGGFFVEGTGITGKFSDTGEEGPTFESSFEQMLYSIGIRGGKSDEGPLAFAFHFGGLTVKIDPTKYARRLMLMGPEIAKEAGRRIGGVSLRVDADALAYAIAGATAPPADFTRTRKAVGLKSLLDSNSSTLGELNEIDGVMIDAAKQDLYFIGRHDEGLPEIPTERVATVERAVYEAGMHPFVSIDPDGHDWKKPHKARVGGVPEDLKSSSLLKTMFTADYSMKRIGVGEHSVEGVPNDVEIMKRLNSPIVPTRFWINPAPLRVGDVRIERGTDKRLYSIETQPVIQSEPFTQRAVSDGDGGVANRIWGASKKVADEETRILTLNFRRIERLWPESDFGQARQDLQLTNLFTLMRAVERDEWTATLLRRLGAVDIPKSDVPQEFQGLRSADFEVTGITTHEEGGMTTDVTLPSVIVPDDGQSVLSAVDWSSGKIDLPARVPTGGEPTVPPADILAAKDLERATNALQAGDPEAAKEWARDSLALRPGSEDAECLLLVAIAKAASTAKGAAAFDAEFSKELDTALRATPKSWSLWLNKALYQANLSIRSFEEADKSRFRTEGVADCDKAIELNPYFAQAYAVRAKFKHRMAKDDDSLKDWDVAIRLEPLSTEYLLGRAGIHAFHERYDDAERDLTLAMSMDTMNDLPVLLRSMIEQKRGHLPEAIRDVEEATHSSPMDWLAHRHLAQYRMEAGDDAGVISELDLALALVPPEALPKKPWTGDPTQAPFPPAYGFPTLWENFTERSCDRSDFAAIEHFPEFDPDMYFDRARAHMHLHHWKEAQADVNFAYNYYLVYDPKTDAELDDIAKQCKKQLGG
jgi:tetratricopeptide (TPR) repeat protein